MELPIVNEQLEQDLDDEAKLKFDKTATHKADQLLIL